MWPAIKPVYMVLIQTMDNIQGPPLT